jgi:hypothetical protein
MKKNKGTVWFILCLFFLYTSCTANINRQGYDINNMQISDKECADIIIAKNISYNPDLAEVVGSIAASDTGFATKCSKKFVIDKFREDACTLCADIINITKESHPDFWSTCYRAKAEFIRVKNRESLATIKSDPAYADQNIKKSSQYSECMNDGIIAAGVLGGLVGGLILHSICNAIEPEDD